MPLTPADIAALSRLLDAAGHPTQPGGPQDALPALPADQAHLAAPLRAMLQARAEDLLGDLPPLPEPAANTGRGGDRVGPYRLLHRIGAGGMGTVWLAARDDGLYDRQVALKLPHAAWGDRLAQRMRHERRAIARLAHPNIARLYDAGVDEHGRPYIAMAYIEGVPIDAWCREQRLDIPARVRLFVQIVQAVAHAHGRHVVHRDIKPANVLVDAEGQAHLLDFGIAKLLDDSGDDRVLTQDTSRVMSAAYAAPEQFLHQAATTATDLYSLGVTLFELLTGRRPHADAGPMGPPPCTVLPAPLASSVVQDKALRQALRGDLDAILARTLDTLPERRYASAQALADDLYAHLQGRPVQARPDSTVYRWNRLAWRHRRDLATAGAFGLLFAAAGWALVTQMRHADEQADTARIAQAFAVDLLQLDGRAAAGTAADGGAAAGPLLARAVALIDARSAHRPALQAHLYGAVARAYVNMGVGKLAVDLAKRHVDTLQRTDATPEARCQALLLLAAAWREQRRFGEAEGAARQAAALMAVDTPAGLQAQAMLAGLLLPNGRKEEARRLIDEAERAWQDRSHWPPLAAALLLDARGRLLEVVNDYPQAVAAWQRAIMLADTAGDEGTALANRIRIRMAWEDLSRNRTAEAHRGLQDATASLQASGAAGRVQAARATVRFAALAHSMGQMDYVQAQALVEGARATVAAMGAHLPEDVMAGIEVSQGWMALRHGDLATARRLLPRAVPIVERATDGLIDLRELAAYQAMLAMASGDHAAADPLLRRRLALRVQAGSGRTPFAATDWQWLSHNLLMAGDAEAAWRVLDEAPDFQALAGDRNAQGRAYANTLPEQRARILLARGDAAAALAALPAPYGLEPLEDRSETVFTPYALRGEVLCAAGRGNEGLPYLQASMEAMAAAVSPADPGLARVRAVAGLCALSLGHAAQARAWAGQSRSALRAQPQVSPWFKDPLQRLETGLVRQVRQGTTLARRAPRPAQETTWQMTSRH